MRFVRRLGLRLAMVLALLASGMVIGMATPAQAACSGVGSPDTITKFEGGREVAREWARENCDNNRVYRGYINDSANDGHCALAQYQDGSYFGTQGTDCTTNGSAAAYSFWDQTGNSSAQVRICSASCGVWWNTWGY